MEHEMKKEQNLQEGNNTNTLLSAVELLNPRYKIIADYPSNQLEVGTIVSCPPYDNEFTKKYWCEMHDKYPHIYQKLEWQENRTIDEMPQYLKDKVTGEIKKVYKHFTYILIDGSMSGEHEAEAVCSFDEIAPSGFEKLFWRYDCCLPSNEKEFLEQQPVSKR